MLSDHRKEGAMVGTFATADLCDANAELVSSGDIRVVVGDEFKAYGERRAFSGAIVTVKVFDDNLVVREMLECEGHGRVLVIDGGGSKRCALLGGNLARLARDCGWAGILVNGCLRDVDEINGCDIGIRALGSHPLRPGRRGIGEKHVAVHVAGVVIRDGEWLYVDADGILVSTSELCV